MANRSELSGLLRRIGLGSWSILGALLLAWVFIWVLVRIQVLIAPIVLSVALIYILNPVVKMLQGRSLPRWLGRSVPRWMAVIVAYVAFTGLLVLIGFIVGPQIADQTSELTSDFPQVYEDARGQIQELLDDVGLDSVVVPTYDEAADLLADLRNEEEIVSQALTRLGDFTLGLLEAILVFFLVPVLAFYVLLDLPRLREESVSLLPESTREETIHVGRQINHALGGFLRGQLLVALIVGVLMSVGFLIIDLPFWLIIGMVAGLLNIIPFVGPWVGGGLGVLAGLAAADVTTALLAGLVALIVQQIDNNFISPTVLRATVRLHPAVIILVLLGGGAVAGIWGVILAVPVAAILKIIAGHLWRTRILGQSWHEAGKAILVPVDAESTLFGRLRKQLDEEE
ncbi:MAG: AI-2E family transporter [Acidimicrobiia bacterium]|nr:AI-2E family transporter [Acidimicrobiia bacterium]NNF69690.1 AI-2E family transporter [Acidimicrobiia bacterium]NNK92572.1 AI-2E family transporter [Acidimicrobiia bacterium]